MIQKLLTVSGFDQAAALRSHRASLLGEIEAKQGLIGEIDRALTFFQKDSSTKIEDLFQSVDLKKQAEYESLLIEKYGKSGNLKLMESKARTKNWTQADFISLKDLFEKSHRSFALAIEEGLSPDHKKVQELVRSHFELISRSWTPDRDSYIGLGRL